MSYSYDNTQAYSYADTTKASKQYSYAPTAYGRDPYSSSPPEASSNRSSAYGGSVYSATSNSSYAGSLSDEYESRSSGSSRGVDLQDYMEDRFSNAYDPLPLDRTLVQQAQT